MADYWLWDLCSPDSECSSSVGWLPGEAFPVRDQRRGQSHRSVRDKFCLGVKVDGSCGGTQPLIVFTFSFSVTFVNPQPASPHNILPVYPLCRRHRRHSLLLITSCTFTSSPSPSPLPLPSPPSSRPPLHLVAFSHFISSCCLYSCSTCCCLLKTRRRAAHLAAGITAWNSTPHYIPESSKSVMNLSFAESGQRSFS